MMRQTGGLAVGEISTRSSPFCLAIATACGGGMMPSCWPVSSITRISRTRIRSLTRTRSSRRGLLSKAITASYLMTLRHRLIDRGLLCPDLFLHFSYKVGDFFRPEIAARAAPDANRSLGALAIPDDEHVGDFLQL